jgi:phosphoglucosamine mutase
LGNLFKPYPQILTNVRYINQTPLDKEIVKTEILKAEEKLGKQGRVLIRKSGTEPLIRIMVEANDNKLMEDVSRHLTDVIKKNL